MMKLHWSPRSPYVRKVMVVAHELGLADRLELVRTVVGGTTPHLELMRENPLGKIPTLVLEDGTIIYNSPVICEYLDTLHDGPKLFPHVAGPADRAAPVGAGRRHAGHRAGMARRAVPPGGAAERTAHGVVGGQDPILRRCAGAGGGCTGGRSVQHRPYRHRHRAVVSGLSVRRPALARRPPPAGDMAHHVRCAGFGGGQSADRRPIAGHCFRCARIRAGQSRQDRRIASARSSRCGPRRDICRGQTANPGELRSVTPTASEASTCAPPR